MRVAVLYLATCISVCCCAQNRSDPLKLSNEKVLHAKRDILRARGTAALDTEYAREKAGRMNECPDANDTVSINKCMDEEFATTQKNYLAYLRSIGALLRLDDIAEPSAVKQLDRAELSWTAYREAQCSAYQHLDPGSIQIFNYETCRLELTRRHMHELEGLYGKDLWE